MRAFFAGRFVARRMQVIATEVDQGSIGGHPSDYLALGHPGSLAPGGDHHQRQQEVWSKVVVGRCWIVRDER